MNQESLNQIITMSKESNLIHSKGNLNLDWSFMILVQDQESQGR
jgi:hypothetical protein